MTPSEAYVVLGVPFGASEKEVTTAFRRMVMLWHPDRNSSPEASEKTQMFNKAMDVLRNIHFNPESSTPHYDFYSSNPYGHGNFYDPFADEEPQRFKAARAIRRKVKLTIEEAAFGCIKSFKGKASDVCTTCKGSRVDPVLKPRTCPTCNGNGRIRGYGMCPSCNGFGDFLQSCRACAGDGKTESKPYSFKANIPPGVRDGDTLIARGVGGLDSEGKSRSDATIVIEITEHSIFDFDKEHLLTIHYPVDIIEVLRGGVVEIPTLFGRQKLRMNFNKFTYRIPEWPVPELKDTTLS
jgi:molecular chaperone DnaJ